MTGKDGQNASLTRLLKEMKRQEDVIADGANRILEHLARPEIGLSSPDLRKRVELLRDLLIQERNPSTLAQTLKDLHILMRQDAAANLFRRQRLASERLVEIVRGLLQNTPQAIGLQHCMAQAHDRLSLTETLEQIAEALPQALANTNQGRQPGVSVHLEQVRQALIRLFDSLLRTASIGPQAARLRERLLNDTEGEPLLLAQAGEEAAGLAIQALQVERKAFANYLTEFRQSLQQGRETTEGCRAELEEMGRYQAKWRSQFDLWIGETEQEVAQAEDLHALQATLKTTLVQLRQMHEQNQSLMESARRGQLDSLGNLESQLHQTQADAAQHKQMAEHYSELSRRDALTQLPNRLAFEERADHELQRWRRYGKSLTLAAIDLDHFKRINDRFGHLVGDRVLQAVAARLRSGLRDVDFVSRSGGEEFVVLLPNTTQAAAGRVLHRLGEQLAAMPFRFRGEQFNITVSIGLGEAQPGDDVETLYGRADDALTLAKIKGRDRLCVDKEVEASDQESA